MIKTSKSNIWFIILLIFFSVVFITNPALYMKSTLNGLTIFFYNVLPALFIFFVISRILVCLTSVNNNRFSKIVDKIFNVQNSGIIFLLSIFAGYPIGAKLICDAYEQNKLDENSCKKMFSFCCISGPMFVIGSIGIGVFRNLKVGYILFASQLIGAILNGLLYRGKTPQQKITLKQESKEQDISKIITESVLDSITSILLVGSFIVISYVLIDILNNTSIIPNIAKFCSILTKQKIDANTFTPIFNGLLEMTRGIIDLGKTNISLNAKLIISSFLIAFSGLSIFLQSISFMKKANIKKSTFLKYKFTQAVFASIICAIFCLFFNI